MMHVFEGLSYYYVPDCQTPSNKAEPEERQLLEALQTRLQRKTPGPWQKRLRRVER